MRVTTTTLPKSSFLSVDKDLNILVDKIYSNESLKKLLFYDYTDALKRPRLTEEETAVLWGNQIKIVPKIYVDSSVLQYIIISFDNFVQSTTNPEFRNNTISFDIICHYDQWILDNNELRPYRIAAELDSMLDKKRLTGIGLLEFLGANQVILNNEFAGLSLTYRAIHGEEDKKFKPDPEAQAAFEQEYKEREPKIIDLMLNGH